MSILTTVAGCGVHPSGVISMSSNECRMSSVTGRRALNFSMQQASMMKRAKVRTRHAAVNARRMDEAPLACWAGGGRGERGEPAAGADRGRAVARQPRGGRLAVVHGGRRVLPGRGQ